MSTSVVVTSIYLLCSATVMLPVALESGTARIFGQGGRELAKQVRLARRRRFFWFLPRVKPLDAIWQ